MTLEVWLAYVAATVILLAVPGPTILLVVGYVLSEGRGVAWSAVAGVFMGDVTALVLSLAGLGALLSASATLFTGVKWLGAAYLVFLGIKMWRARPNLEAIQSVGGNGSLLRRKVLAHAFAVTALNPKGIVFFVAFLPQFVNQAHPVLPQVILLGGTFLVLALLNVIAYILFAAKARKAVARPATLRAANRVGGTLLIGAGLMTAALRR